MLFKKDVDELFFIFYYSINILLTLIKELTEFSNNKFGKQYIIKSLANPL